ncbi:UDP-N-acetylmuramate--L-alanine ligase [Croceimicrobium hydrocarbonivorans]|uniref:Peptidoglycan synthetase n=1 Tax=Croceimicrobium hydrocarbonivorans TaxID=2761580 RepID=A0A7H0VDK0_9FLAO|nr:Mur ligase family protein [Croceimicrobium hydrocarbonivorans]QNR23798.1 peptidoglycan synthetase [Croceimicrobium hydrocarbonivorans]
MKIHLIAIGGSAMHNLALALHQQGHDLSGSDDEIFEPSRSRLADTGILPESMGWDANRIHSDIDMVVVGMHARKDNPELLKALDLGLKVLSYPEYLYESSKDKTRVVITGSHGKTTITSMILHVLNFHGRDCDYMVGAQLEGFHTMVRLTDHNEFMVIEGDEYLSSPLDPRPKFVHYRPNIALLSGIAWDHYNVFPKFEEYRHQFELLFEYIEPGGQIIYNADDSEVKNLVESATQELKKFPYQTPAYRVEDQQFILETIEGDLPLQVFGAHNMNNLEGARWVCSQMGITDEEFYEAIVEFEGASKRMEPLIETDNLKVFRDFAHAPSKVKASVQACRETFGDSRFLAVLELHTFSSLNLEFMQQYANSMDPADTAIVYFNPEVLAHKKLPALSIEAVQKAFASEKVKVIMNSAELETLIQEQKEKHEIIVLMSSGNFDGIDWTKVFD